MAIQRPIKTPSGAVFAQGYEWIASLQADFAGGQGSIVLNGHNSAQNAAAGLPPDVTYLIRCGQEERDAAGNVVAFPTLAQLVADNQAHFAAIEAYLYAKAAAMPSQAGASLI